MKRWNREIEGARPWMNREARFILFLPMTRGGENKGRGESSFRGRISARKIDRFPG